MSIAQRTQLAALRAMRNHPELGKTNEERRLPTAQPVEAPVVETKPEPTGKACPMALKLLLED